jgi:fibro-slime domain-containing protein
MLLKNVLCLILGASGAASLIAACGSRTPIGVEPLDICYQEGAIEACRNDCGDGQRVCTNGHFEPCEVPVAQRTCTDVCGAGSQTCTTGTWSPCDVPIATRDCADVCGSGSQTCTAGAWNECDVPVATRDCTNRCGNGTQTCSSGAWNDCQVAPTTIACTNECGNGVQTCVNGVGGPCQGVPVVTRACSTNCGKGMEACVDGAWQPCDAPTEGVAVVTTTIRDFNDTHPDFERTSPGGLDTGIVMPDLGPDDKPVYAGNPTTPTTSGKVYFDQWYRDTPGVNLTTSFVLAPTASSTTDYIYDNDAFFPIDNQLWGNQGRAHNYHFTLELATQFRYNGGETFRFTGDDDLFVFVNRKLAINLGGFHQALSGSIDLDARAAEFGLVRGNLYPFHLFFAERHTIASTLHIETTIADFLRCQ